MRRSWGCGAATPHAWVARAEGVAYNGRRSAPDAWWCDIYGAESIHCGDDGEIYLSVILLVVSFPQGEPYVKDLLSNNSSNVNPIILKVNLRKDIE